MRNVTNVMQSNAILHNLSNYWISVINGGRHFLLNEVMKGGGSIPQGSFNQVSIFEESTPSSTIYQ
jgi:hypothetical protein